MITGRQIREARVLLGWGRQGLALRAKVELSTVKRAEAIDGEPPITIAQAAKIEGAFKTAGIEFTTDGLSHRKMDN